MARLDYDPVQSVSPDARAPDDYVRVDATPASFGGLIGQGVQKLGAGAMGAVQHWDQFQTDDMTNQYERESSAVVEQFKGMQGQDALNAHDATRQQIEDMYDSYRSKLGTLAQQHQFDQANRPFTDRYLLGQVSTHAIEQGQNFAINTANDGIKNAASMAATAGSYGHEATATVAYQKALDSGQKALIAQGRENDPDAVQTMRQTAAIATYKSYADTLAVKNPKAALDFTNRHKDDLGTAYAPLADDLRNRATKQTGDGLAAEGMSAATNGYGTGTTTVSGSPWHDPNSAQVRTAAGVAQGFSPEGLAKTVAIENPRSDPNITNASGHKGLGQFDDATWATYGHGSVFDPQENLNGIQRLAAANRDQLTQTLGRPPTDGELYLAHQQGATGAALLLANPNLRAGDLVGDAAIRQNGGDPNKPASAFISMWTSRFGAQPVAAAAATQTPGAAGGGTPGVQPASFQPGAAAGATVQPASATTGQPATPTPTQTPQAQQSPEDLFARQIQYIEQHPGYTDDEKKAALQTAELNYRVSQLASEQDARAKAAQKEQTFNTYNGMLNHGDFAGAYKQLANDQSIDETTRATLQELIEKRSGNPDPVSYGPQYKQYLDRVLAPANDPNRITDIGQLYRAEADGDITTKAAERLKTVLMDTRKSTDVYGEQRMVQSAFDFAKRHLSFENPDLHIADPKGQDILDTVFPNVFYRQLDEWKQSGKPTSDFPLFDQKNLTNLVNYLRHPQDKNDDYLKAVNQTTGDGSAQPPPPAPAQTNAAYWSQLMQSTPAVAGGQRMPAGVWADSLQKLISHADDATYLNRWDEAVKSSRYRAKDVLDSLGVSNKAHDWRADLPQVQLVPWEQRIRESAGAQ